MKATEEIKERNETLSEELKKVKGINQVNTVELKKLREHQSVYNSAIEQKLQMEIEINDLQKEVNKKTMQNE